MENDLSVLTRLELAKDWVRDAVGKEDTEAVRIARTVYLLSKLADLHGPKMSSTNTNFRGLWKRMEQSRQ